MSGIVERARAFDTKANDAWGILQEMADEIERLILRLKKESSLADYYHKECERLRAREAQARTIILAAGAHVPELGGWPALWHRDADKWLGVNAPAQDATEPPSQPEPSAEAGPPSVGRRDDPPR
jgi:hypothetical protein